MNVPDPAKTDAPAQEAHFPEGTTQHVASLASGIRMAWHERGTGDVILFLHGFPELGLSFRDQFALSEKGFRCVAPDLRGYGDTDAPAGWRAYGMRSLCADVLALIDALNVEKVHLVAHDWGGGIAWDFARAHPHRVKTLSVLNCPPAEMMKQELLRNPAQVKRSWYMVFFQLPKIPERMLLRDPVRFMVRAFRANAAPANRKRFTAASVAPFARAHARTRLAGVNYYRAALRTPGVQFLTTKLSFPVQLIWGLQDGALGPWFCDAARYTDIASDFRVVRLEHAGHWVQQEAPEQVNHALLELIDPQAVGVGA
jgi:pimeloyl-ACP methyl ester carboxylesterase